jgi:putative ATP-binding cassette transporter
MARGFWSGSTRGRAWFLTVAVLSCVLGNLAVQVAANRWNKFFFNALEKKDSAALYSGIALIFGIAFVGALVAVLLIHFRLRLQVRWRQWLASTLTRRWLSDRRFYQLNVIEGDSTNPEYRISDDTRMATEPLVEFAIGLVNAILIAVTFIGILWVVGGSLQFDLGGRSFDVPGYMVWAVIIYSGIASASTVLISRPLVRRVERKNASEGRYKYELTRVRESAETIALIGGDDDERGRLDATMKDVVQRWIGVINQQARLTWVINGNAILAPVVPLLLGAPKYLSGAMSLGDVMQIATAFFQVQVALNWVVENAIRIAEWMASAQRVVELDRSLDDLDESVGKDSQVIELGVSPDNQLHLQDLSVRLRNGRIMIQGAEAVVPQGSKVLVKGDSGSGKSTLIRAIAGLWPWGAGRILLPEGAKVTFMPQRPYVPLGSLRRALLYPEPDRDVPDEDVKAALARTGLGHLEARLDEDDQWGRILSGGEQQRLAFARLILDPPDIVIMDEATAALDEASQASMLDLFHEQLSAASVVNVAHRPGLERWHDGEIMLIREGGTGSARASQRSTRKWWKRALFGRRPADTEPLAPSDA